MVSSKVDLGKICKKKPKLSQQTIIEIKQSRENIKKGEFSIEEEAKKILF